MKPRLTWIASAVAALALGGGLLGSSSAEAAAGVDNPPKPGTTFAGEMPERLSTASPAPAGFASWDDLLAVQEKLSRAAARLEALDGTGYSGIVVSPERNLVALYWNGAMTARERTVLGSMRSSVAVDLVAAPYSRRTLLAEVRRVAAQPGVATVAPRPDGTGLRVAMSTAAGRRSAASVLTSTVPLILEPESTQPRALSRENDRDPFYGGARVSFGGGPECSTGFPVVERLLTYPIAHGMLSAGHCGSVGETVGQPGTGNSLGSVVHDDDIHDSLVIDVQPSRDPRVAPYIYEGGVLDQPQYYSPVVGDGPNFVGEYVCTSGAFSGTMCGGRVDAVDVSIDNGPFGGGRSHPDVVAVSQIDGYPLAGDGDSGGPVYSYQHGGSPDAIIARGIVVAGDARSTVPCRGVPTSAGRSCSSVVYYTDIRDVVSWWDAKNFPHRLDVIKSGDPY
ncbi:MAG: S1 family peptidase [Dermatophilaceae bacterium]